MKGGGNYMQSRRSNKVPEGLRWVRIIGYVYNDYVEFCINRGTSLTSFVGILTFLRDNNYLNISQILKDYKI